MLSTSAAGGAERATERASNVVYNATLCRHGLRRWLGGSPRLQSGRRMPVSQAAVAVTDVWSTMVKMTPRSEAGLVSRNTHFMRTSSSATSRRSIACLTTARPMSPRMRYTRTRVYEEEAGWRILAAQSDNEAVADAGRQ